MPTALAAPGAWRTAVVVTVAAWALLFFPQLFLGRHFVLGDASAFRPFSEFSRARWLESRERTYWNPYVFTGIEAVASLADPRPQYLPDPLLDVTERLSEPRFSPQLWLLLAQLIGALAVMELARRLWRADAWSAAVGALSWLLATPILFPLAYGHDAQFLSDALLPAVVLGTYVVLAGDGWRAPAVGALGLSLATGVQCLHGHPQIVVYSSAFALLFALQQAWVLRRWRRLVLWGSASALGSAIAVAVWWPAMLYSAQSFRGGAGAPGQSMLEVAKFSLGFRDLISLVWPQSIGFGGATYWGGMLGTDYSPYLGAVAVALALRGSGRRAIRRDPTAAFLWAAVAGAVVLSLGATLGPLFAMLRQTLPLWTKFRVPFYVLVVACMALALLAARGAAGGPAAFASPAAPTSRRTLAIVAGAIVLGWAIGFGPLRPPYTMLAHAMRSALDAASASRAATAAGTDLALRATLAAAAWTIAAARGAGRRWSGPVLALLVALDLGTVAAPALVRATGPLSALGPPAATPLAKVAARDPRGRAYVGAGPTIVDSTLGIGQYSEVYTNFWVSWRARCLTGNHGAVPAVWRLAMSHDLIRHAAVLRAWGVTCLDLPLAARPDSGLLTPLDEDRNVRAYALSQSLGRAYAVPLVIAVADAEEVARGMSIPGFDPARVGLTTDPAAAGEYPGSSACTIRWVRDEPEHMVIAAEAPGRAFLVVADSDFPGWRASVDGRPAPIVPANLIARGLVLPPGRHAVALRYETLGLRPCVAITRAGLTVWCLLAIAFATATARSAWRASRRT